MKIHVMLSTLACVISLSFAGAVSATTLFDRGNGMVYDSVNDVTWLQDGAGNGDVSYANANTWVENLNYAGFSDWRMPHHSGATFEEKGLIFEEDEVFSLWWRMLETGNPNNRIAEGITFTNVGSAYWTDFAAPDFSSRGVVYFTGYGPGNYATNSGDNEMVLATTSARVWAVRDGDVAAVPLPGAVWLFGSVLAGCGVFRRRSA